MENESEKAILKNDHFPESIIPLGAFRASSSFFQYRLICASVIFSACIANSSLLGGGRDWGFDDVGSDFTSPVGDSWARLAPDVDLDEFALTVTSVSKSEPEFGPEFGPVTISCLPDCSSSFFSLTFCVIVFSSSSSGSAMRRPSARSLDFFLSLIRGSGPVALVTRVGFELNERVGC